MPYIHYFNPENDLALAANDPHYTPPASALQMATDLQRLPLRWARPGDLVLLRDGTLISASPDAAPHSPSRLLPWGWSPLAITAFRRAGIPDALLPSDSEMHTFRTLAGRATAADVLLRLRRQLDEQHIGHCFTGEAYVCRSLEEACDYHSRFGESIFKQPWSGSGRGLMPAHDGRLTDKNTAWLQRTLCMQGYVMAEPRYDRRADFALEFWRHSDGSITYEGLSLFMTTAGGVYAGNIVDTEERKWALLLPLLPPSPSPSSSSLPSSPSFPSSSSSSSSSSFSSFSSSSSLPSLPFPLVSLISSIPSLLSPFLPSFYSGPIGVDMLITRDGLIHPCVEINFRMTMGWVALHV